MPSNRREFIERLTATAMFGAVPLSALPTAAEMLAAEPRLGAQRVDMSWTTKLKGKKHRACYDCAEHEHGAGVWRSSMWEAQYESALGVKRSDVLTVMILRHNAAILALTQEMWDRYGIGATSGVHHPATNQVTTRNPVLLRAADGVAPMFETYSLPSFLARGGVVLACGTALNRWSGTVARQDGISAADAYQRTLAGLVPGVIVQPSGVFAAVKAQEEGCVYVRAS